MREHHVSLAEASLASHEVELQERIEKGMAESHRSLLLAYRAKLRLQESLFLERCGHLKNEVNTLRKSESVSSPLVPEDAGYLGFFLRIVERLEAGAAKALALTEGKSRDLLDQVASDVFNHLLRVERDFDFAAVRNPLSETIRAALAEWVEVHVQDLVTRLAPEGHGMDSSDDVSS
ncbi:hypothetical protein D1007_22992 [Hordeum vulgare]|nr:hypothetical protein D1007_22992 [Hordeum vulgare]